MIQEHKFWDTIAISHLNKAYIVNAIGEYKGNEVRNLISSWIGETEGLRVLKTDLFEEALGPDQFLFYMFKKDNIFGTDISYVVARHAKIRASTLGRICHCCVGDARQLPYKDESFDIIISNSTLDHFRKNQLPMAIAELKRVLKKRGKIILTINNKHNKNFYFVLRLGRMFGAIPYHVEFYSIGEIKHVIKNLGLRCKDTSAIIHLFSPLNKSLLLIEKIIGKRLIDRFARYLAHFGDILNKKKTKFLTGWFLAFLLTNHEE